MEHSHGIRRSRAAANMARRLAAVLLVLAAESGFALAAEEHNRLAAFGGGVMLPFSSMADGELASVNLFGGYTKFYDDGDNWKKVCPIFDMQAGFCGGWNGRGDGFFGMYTQLTGGVSLRPVPLLLFNFNAGGQLSVFLPLGVGVGIVAEASFTLNLWDFIGAKIGLTASLGTTGAGVIPYLAVIWG